MPDTPLDPDGKLPTDEAPPVVDFTNVVTVHPEANTGLANPADAVTSITPVTPAPKPKPKKSEKKAEPTSVMFESTNEEPIQFDICGVRGHRDPSGKKVRWRVPVERVERFSRHSHVVSGRVRVLGNKE